MRAVHLMMIMVLLVVGCAAEPARDARACGTENQRHGTGYDLAMRNCLWQAYLDKQAATFTTTILTEEGDPITSTVSVDARGQVKVVRDTTKDKFGDQKVTTYRCKSLDRPDVDPGPGRRPRADFVARDCKGGDYHEVAF